MGGFKYQKRHPNTAELLENLIHIQIFSNNPIFRPSITPEQQNNANPALSCNTKLKLLPGIWPTYPLHHQCPRSDSLCIQSRQFAEQL